MAKQKRKDQPARDASQYAAEALEYYANARQLLRSIPIRHEGYTDVKRVREACGTAYLAVLAAARSFLLSEGMRPDKLPEEYKTYGQALSRRSTRNGKVMKAFHRCYRSLHLDGYYRGFTTVRFGKEAFQDARFLIERLTGQKVEPTE